MLTAFETLESRRLLDGTVAAIVGGQASPKGEWPWMVSLQWPGFGHFCGGSLIAPDVVLTAAHCVEGQSVASIDAVIGRQDLDDSDGQTIDVAEIHIHHAYEPFTNAFDAALLTLADEASVTPVRYLTPGQSRFAEPGVVATVLGWGATREGGHGSTELQQVSVPIVSNAVANEPRSYGGIVSADMLAAGPAEGGKDSCQGDSGGPLTVFDDGATPLVAGIVSWGEGCARRNKYGIYSRVTAVADWLDEMVGPDSKGRITFAQDRYLADGSVELRLRDGDLRASQVVDVTVTSESGDLEVVRMSPLADGRFVGTIVINTDQVVPRDGALNVIGEEQIYVSYRDEDDGSGMTTTVTQTASVVEDDYGQDPRGAAELDVSGNMLGEIELSGDADWFRFEAELGRAYSVRVLLNGTLDDSAATVYASDGEMVLGFDNDSGRGLGSRLTFVPAADGERFIAVTASNASVGTYELRVQEIDPPDDDHTNGAASATVANAPSTILGNIQNSIDVDWFSFEATAGLNYEIAVGIEGRSLPDSVLRLFDSDGHTELSLNDDRSRFDRGSTIYWSAPTSGRKFVEVSGYQGAQGTYRVSLTTVRDDHANLVADATRLAVSSNLTTVAGEITPLDVDRFVFSATEDRFYEFSTRLVTLPDSVLTIFDRDGTTRVARNDDKLGSRASRVVWQAHASGDFTVEVAGFDIDAGDYQLEVREVSPPRDDFGNRVEHASLTTVPAVVGGIIDYEGDRDWLSFEAFAGQRYTFEIELRSLADSVLRLFDEEETLLAENDDIGSPNLASRIAWTASISGVNLLEVSGFDGDTGTYRVRIEREFAVGDFDQDNVVSPAEIDRLLAATRESEPPALFDLNDDATVDNSDVDYLLGLLGTIRGDTDLNGRVEFADFLALSGAFGSLGGWVTGDFDGDGHVQFADFLALSNSFGFNRQAEDFQTSVQAGRQVN